MELIAEDVDKNKKELFNSKKNKKFNLFSKNHFIVLLIITISFLILISIILTGAGFNFKINLGETLKDYFYLEINNTYLITFSYFELWREDVGGVYSIGARAVRWIQGVIGRYGKAEMSLFLHGRCQLVFPKNV